MQGTITQSLLNKKIAGAIEDKVFFNQPYLKPEDPRCTPDEYFKEIS